MALISLRPTRTRAAQGGCRQVFEDERAGDDYSMLHVYFMAGQLKMASYGRALGSTAGLRLDGVSETVCVVRPRPLRCQ